MNSRTVALVQRIDQGVMRIGNVMSIIFAVVVCIAFYEVIMRYAFNAPTSWVHETTTFLVSLCLLYGGVYCYAADRHIAMVFIVQRFGQKFQWYAKFIVNNLTLLFVSMLLHGAYFSATDAFYKPNGKFHMQTSGSILDSPFPALSKAFLLVCCTILFGLVILHYARHLVVRKAVFDGTYVEPTLGEQE